MKQFLLFFILFIAVFSHTTVAAEHVVPDNYSSIQEAIDAAANGDTVLVKPGIYYENIVLKMKRIIVCSLFQETGDSQYINQTIIDGHTNGSVVKFQDSDSELIGFSIQNGYAPEGGGIYCQNSSSHLSHLIVKDNKAYNDISQPCVGGGISILGNMPLIEHVQIYDNTSEGGGAGIIILSSSPTLRDVIIHNNSSPLGNGGGIYFGGNSCQPYLENVQIYQNFAGVEGGGIYCIHDCRPYLNNVVIRENTAGEKGGGFVYYCPSPQQPSALPFFDQTQLCSIFLNHAAAGNDLASNWPLNISLDWFTVKNPTSFHAIPLQNFTMTVSRGKLNQVKANLFVKPDGNNTNSGLSWANALQSIQCALCIIFADKNNPRTIYLAPGIFKENEQYPLSSVSYITLQGSGVDKTILDGSRKSRIIKIYSSTDFMVRALTIRNGETIHNGLVGENEYGAGVHCNYSTRVKLEKLKIIDNHALTHTSMGGGIYCAESSIIIKNTLIANNESYYSGAGIAVWDCAENCPIELINVVIANNSVGGYGGGIDNPLNGQQLKISNSIIWGNHSQAFDKDHSQIFGSGITFSYTDLQGGALGIIEDIWGTIGWCNWLEGNTVIEPQFVDEANYNFKLQEGSSVIDAGNPAPLYFDRHGQGNKRNDMGIFGGAGLNFNKDDLLGTWPGLGIWQRNSDTGDWSLFLDKEAIQIYLADLNGDFLDDVAGWWDDGIWLKLTNQESWQKIIDQKNLFCLAVGDLSGDGKKDLVGTWSDRGIWLWNAHSGQWTKLHDEPAKMLTAGDIDSDGRDDLIGLWESGIWIRYSGNGNWQRILDAQGVRFITAGDLNGDGRDDIVGSWDNKGVWWRNSNSGKWDKLHDQPADKLACGDIDEDGQDDLLGVWNDIPGVWLRYSIDGSWISLHELSAFWLTAGRMR